MASVSGIPGQRRSEPQLGAVDVGWVVRKWCVWVAVGLVVLGALNNALSLFGLWGRFPLDLSEDEAHYWEWSRHLDYGYYSKPPGIAWVIWLTLKVGGWLHLTGDGSGAALMPVMRLAAVAMGVGSGLLSLFLARRMFKDDRVAFAVIGLSAAVPMFAVGSLLITIDSPMYLCWAGTVYCLWRVVEERGQGSGAKGQRGISWLYGAGLACAVGMLFKPVLIAVLPCLWIAARLDGGIRKAFRTRHTLWAGLLVLLSQVPWLVWNGAHGWVTFRHMLTQGGMGKQSGTATWHWYGPFARLGEYIGGQAGGMAGLMFALLVIAVVLAWGRVRKAREGALAGGEMGLATRSGWVFLLSFTLPLWGFYLVMNLWTKTEVNWPAASYFTGMILLSGMFTEGWNSATDKVRRGWQNWGAVTICWGFLLTMLAMNTHRLYGFAAGKLEGLNGTEQYFKSAYHPRQWDQPMFRLRGLQDRAEVVEKVRQEMVWGGGKEVMIIGDRYSTASSLSFYMPGHPFAYCIMSSTGGRHNQYDVWPGLNEKDGSGKLVNEGKWAVIVGSYDPWVVEEVLKKSFDKVVGPEVHGVTFEGVEIKQIEIYRGYGFKGLPEREAGAF